ncbi:NACHT domain-containing protein [Aerosakkonema funiforme]|uniref:NACHT domain-containing protein n=1 Tax=Aerosakkonema funiforme TaxID=1246630 RepID=UPI0035B810FC
MSKVQKSRSVWIDEDGLREIKKRMAEIEKPEQETRNRREKKYWTVDYLARQAYVGRSTVIRLLNKKVSIDETSAIAILTALGFDPLNFIAKHDRKLQTSNQVPRLNTVIDWRLVCQEMLQEQQEEQRFRRRATEQGFEVRVYVPLGLVERKQQQRRSGILPMEKVQQLEEEVIVRTYKHNEFLNDVIGQKSANKNKHIAIVGEPGVGKTTLLDKIATHIQKNTEDLPICISLGSLQGKKLKEYILEEWLPEAIALTYPEIDIETFHQTSLQKRLRQGGVWLLLDGVDEMGETSPAKALESIQNQLTDWLGKVRVVLTCRTNVWDYYLNNRLIGFDTYKTQHFEPADIRRFIKQWFGFAGKPELGKILRQKLNEPQRDRIRQLVENPLRLALLCQVFHKDKQAELPETKAGLYELFVRYFYEWKPTQCSVDLTTQPGLKEELHQALGRLSIAGLDSDARFRLPESLVQKEMGDRLFKLAWEIGWLNLVDREATTDEPVYAFFHPTFQEYFAALAINNYEFFLTPTI